MSNFNSYMKRADRVARNAFSAYLKAEDAYNKAKEQAEKYPHRSGVGVDAKYMARSARAQADLLEEKENLRKAQQELESRKQDFAQIRSELEADIEEEYLVDPKKLDLNTLELMKSGILKGNDYQKIMNDAIESDNITMIRMIGKYAGEALSARQEKNGHQYDDESNALSIVTYQANNHTGQKYLNQFDVLQDAFNRSVRNHAMIPAWDKMTGSIVSGEDE